MAVTLHATNGNTYQYRLDGLGESVALDFLLSEARAPGDHFVPTETGEYVNLAQIVTIRVTKSPE
jgi:hypothetical protein